jgi:hypothetical protein
MQNNLIFDENIKQMKELISTSEKIRQANEVEVKLSLHQKVYKCKLAIGKVTKNANNPHFKKSYADLNAIIEAVEPILLENGLLLLQPIHGNSVCTQIIDLESNDMIESCIDLPTGIDPQKMGSAITYYRRYTLQSILSLQAVDDDGNMASQPVKEEPKAKVKESLPTERFNNALAKIKAKEYTVGELKAKFNLTKEQEAQL